MLKSNRVVVCAGSGGVGKTTMAAALGLRAAELGLRALVLTVDPAKRLATALSLELDDVSERTVPLKGSRGSLAAAVIDSKAVFDEFIARYAGQKEVIARIMKNRLYQQLSTTLAGSQEFTALERLLQAEESGRYDLIVLDTPPTKHAVDFLTAPQRINALFQEGITRWFLGPGEKSGGLIANLVGRGTRVALKSLETLTGGQFIEELLDFFAAIRSVQKFLRERSEKALQLLQSPHTKFFVVTSFDAAKLLEAKYLRGELQRLGYTLQGVVINRAFPMGLETESTIPEQARAQTSPEILAVADFYHQFRNYYANRYDLYDGLARDLEADTLILRVPEYQRDVYGLDDLSALAQVLGEGGVHRGVQ